MQLRERTETEHWNEFLISVVQPGDVLEVSPNHFVLVITRDRHGDHSFYYTPCNFDGTLTTKKYKCSAANYINNSIMLTIGNKSELQLVNSVELESHTIFNNCKRYTWFLTGDREIDAYMSNLDARWSLFVDTCNEAQRQKYAEQEDINYHQENGYFVGLHAKLFLADKLIKINRWKR